MKKLIFVLALLMPLAAAAQNVTLISDRDSLPSIVDRILAERDLPTNFRHIKSHINLEFVTSANAYLTEHQLD